MRLSFGLLAGNSLPDLVRLARQAESLGYDTLWIAEDYFYGGAFTTTTACAAATERIRLGIGVINPYTRNPALIAMEAGALDTASEGRLVLGLGASNRRWIQEMAGIPFEKPVTAMKETVEIINRLIAGEKVTYKGKMFNITGVQLEFEPFRRHIPIHLGVKGPVTLSLAGQIADGVLLSVLSSPPYVRWAVERIKEGAAKVGRQLPEDFEVGTYLLISPDNDRQKAREAVRPVIAHYLGLHGQHPILLEAGLTVEEIMPFRQALLAGESAAHLVDDRLIDLFSVAGTPAECAERLQAWIEAGVNNVCAFEVKGTDPSALMETIAKYLM